MKSLVWIMAILVIASNAWGTPTAEQPDRNISVYNPQTLNLGLLGYDPVTYFAEFGGQALVGDPAIAVEYGGLTYHFTSEATRDEFLSNPAKYEPTYGAWCAWAMANGNPIRIQPEYFTEHNGRMHFFVEAGAKSLFDNDIQRREADADQNWFQFSQESPRL